MSERKQRTPAEIIEETEAKLAKLKVKQAKKDAMSNPAIAPLVEELEGLRKDIREARKGLGTGPQSFDARLKKHQVWIEKIEDQIFEAQTLLDRSEARKLQIEQQIADVIGNLINDQEAKVASANS